MVDTRFVVIDMSVGVPTLRPPRAKPLWVVLSLLRSYPSLRPLVLIRDKTVTENGLKPEENVMHAILFLPILRTLSLRVECERPLGSVPMPPERYTQRERENDS